MTPTLSPPPLSLTLSRCGICTSSREYTVPTLMVVNLESLFTHKVFWPHFVFDDHYQREAFPMQIDKKKVRLNSVSVTIWFPSSSPVNKLAWQHFVMQCDTLAFMCFFYANTSKAHWTEAHLMFHRCWELGGVTWLFCWGNRNGAAGRHFEPCSSQHPLRGKFPNPLQERF